MPVSKVFPNGFGRYHGRVVEINKIIGDEVCCHVVYSDSDSEDMSYAAAIDHYEAHCDERFISLLDSIIPAFEYLNDRLNDNCRSLAHGCFEMHRLFRLAQAFDPSEARSINLVAFIGEMETIPALTSPFRDRLLTRMRGEIPEYQTLLGNVDVSKFNHRKPPEFTRQVLGWWKAHRNELEAWSEAARIIFAMKPTSAMTERVFSMLSCAFPPNRNGAAMDMIEASLMVKFNSDQRDAETKFKFEIETPDTPTPK